MAETQASAPVSTEASGERGAAVVAEGLTVSLGSRQVLQDVCLTASHGAITALVGPNGAGKSTLLRAIAGLLPYRGRLEIDGAGVRQLRPSARARLVAYLPQRSALTAGLRVERVVQQGRFAFDHWLGKARRTSIEQRQGPEAVERAMRATDITDLRHRRFTELSMGERRRVLLARGLATGAKILLLDEPTSALDIRHILELEVLLRELAGRGYAVIIVLHALNEVRRIADAAVLLCGGKVRQAGPAAEVIHPSPIRSAYEVEILPSSGLDYRLPTREPGS